MSADISKEQLIEAFEDFASAVSGNSCFDFYPVASKLADVLMPESEDGKLHFPSGTCMLSQNKPPQNIELRFDITDPIEQQFILTARTKRSAMVAVRLEMITEGSKGHLISNGQTKAWPAYEKAEREYNNAVRMYFGVPG